MLDRIDHLPYGATAASHPQATAANGMGRGLYWVDTQQYFSGGSSQASPNFAKGITYQRPIPVPPSNSQLPTIAASSFDNGQGGCTYWGPTRIHFNGDGTISVLSPDTIKGSNPGYNCSVDGTPMSIPPDGVIYVKNWTAEGPTDPTANHPTSACVAPSSSFLTLAVNPTAKDTVLDPDAPVCTVGNAYIGGSFGKNQTGDTSALTIGSDNNIVVYQDTTYADPNLTATNLESTAVNLVKDTAVLGLEPTNAVDLYHPVMCTGGSSCAAPNWQNMEYPTATCPKTDSSACTVYHVAAAVIAYNHAYQLENYWYGANLDGSMSFTGSLSERYRGRMAGTGYSGYTGSTPVSSSGYSKNYNYDERFRYLTPPSFLPPNIFSWTQSQWADTTTTSAK